MKVNHVSRALVRGKILCLAFFLTLSPMGFASGGCGDAEGPITGQAGVDVYYKNDGNRRLFYAYNGNSYAVWVTESKGGYGNLVIFPKDCADIGITTDGTSIRITSVVRAKN